MIQLTPSAALFLCWIWESALPSCLMLSNATLQSQVCFLPFSYFFLLLNFRFRSETNYQGNFSEVCILRTNGIILGIYRENSMFCVSDSSHIFCLWSLGRCWVAQVNGHERHQKCQSRQEVTCPAQGDWGPVWQSGSVGGGVGFETHFDMNKPRKTLIFQFQFHFLFLGGGNEKSTDVICALEGDSISITCPMNGSQNQVGMYLRNIRENLNVIYFPKDKSQKVDCNFENRTKCSKEGETLRITLDRLQQSDSQIYLCSEMVIINGLPKELNGKKTIVLVKGIAIPPFMSWISKCRLIF